MAHKNLIKVYDYYGEKIVKAMKNILIKKNKRATGRLINSIDYTFANPKKGIIQLIIEYAPYGNLVAGKPSPVWKKGKGPPIQAIRAWLQAKNIPFRQTAGKKLSRKKQLDAMTYLIIRKIKQRKKLNPAYNNPTDFTKPYDIMMDSKEWRRDITIAAVKDAKEVLKK